MNYKYRDHMNDQVKQQVIKWATENPHWSPEALISVTKMFLKIYGLRNARYLPPDFKREETEVPKDADIQRVEGTNVGTTQP